jgi:hypothetical protein
LKVETILTAIYSRPSPLGLTTLRFDTYSEQKPLSKNDRVGISACASSYQRLEGFLFDFLRVEIARLLWHIHECGHYLIMTFLRPFLRTAKIEYLCESSTPEAEFSNAIETKVFRVFLLTIHSHLPRAKVVSGLYVHEFGFWENLQLDQ